jgi:hypothetical protein
MEDDDRAGSVPQSELGFLGVAKWNAFSLPGGVYASEVIFGAFGRLEVVVVPSLLRL